MGSSGLGPPTSRLSGVRSNRLSYEPILYSRASPLPLFCGGGKRIRTDDPLLAKQVLYQLSYTPVVQPAFTLSRCLQRLENYIASKTILLRKILLPSNKLRNSLHATRPKPSVRGCVLPRKEVIQPHLPIRLPCYDFTPVIDLAFGSSPLAVRILTSGTPNSHGVTGGVYKARERIHRGILIRDY